VRRIKRERVAVVLRDFVEDDAVAEVVELSDVLVALSVGVVA